MIKLPVHVIRSGFTYSSILPNSCEVNQRREWNQQSHGHAYRYIDETVVGFV